MLRTFCLLLLSLTPLHADLWLQERLPNATPEASWEQLEGYLTALEPALTGDDSGEPALKVIKAPARYSVSGKEVSGKKVTLSVKIRAANGSGAGLVLCNSATGEGYHLSVQLSRSRPNFDGRLFVTLDKTTSSGAWEGKDERLKQWVWLHDPGDQWHHFHFEWNQQEGSFTLRVDELEEAKESTVFDTTYTTLDTVILTSRFGAMIKDLHISTQD